MGDLQTHQRRCRCQSSRTKNNFREGPQIPHKGATLADYRSSGYRWGHLAPAADMAFSKQTMSEGFYLSNISPQKPSFNLGIWNKLEEQVRHFAIVETEIYVVTGPIFPTGNSVTIGNGKIPASAHFYKMIYDLTPLQKMIAFIISNDGSRQSFRNFAVTVNAVEAVTGLVFFCVPQPEQYRLESTIISND